LKKNTALAAAATWLWLEDIIAAMQTRFSFPTITPPST